MDGNLWPVQRATKPLIKEGMGVHLPSLSNTNPNLGASYTEDLRLMCKSGLTFRMYPQLKADDSVLVFPHPPDFIAESGDKPKIGRDADPSFIIENPGRPAAHLRKKRGEHKHSRDVSREPINSTKATSRQPLVEHLIISPNSKNSASELCGSRFSFGRSFASVQDKLFCDMTDKTLYFICSNDIKTCCLDTKEASFRACQKDSEMPPADPQSKTVANQTNHVYPNAKPSRLKGDRVYDSVQRW